MHTIGKEITDISAKYIVEEGLGNLKLIGCTDNKKNEKNLINIFNKFLAAKTTRYDKSVKVF